MIVLNMQDTRPIYVQIVDGMKEQVIRGLLKPGDQIPSIRQLAGMLVVTPNTVSKAYQELERQSIIVSVRGKGNFINDIPKGKGEEQKMEQIEQQLKQLCIEWHYVQGDKEKLKQLIDTIYQELEGR